MSLQDELNRLRIAKNVTGLKGTAPMTSTQCLNVLAGRTTLETLNLDAKTAANTWASTVNQPVQVALNVKAGRNWTVAGLLTKQDAAKAISTP
jgi:hypothetical protein